MVDAWVKKKLLDWAGTKMKYFHRKMFLFEDCKKRIEVKVNIEKQKLLNKNVDWYYSIDPLNEKAEWIKRTSNTGKLASDIYEIASKKKMTTEYFNKLEAYVDLINESYLKNYFNYYIKGRTNFLKSIRSQPVLFMVPGDLTTYKFVLEYIGETQDQIVDFKVKIENWFLRAFAPELEFRYDKKIDRIVWYQGISNIKSNDGKVMNVTIDYKY